jgi:leucyl/phenylalanyl-tRNA---protein transferase
MYGCAGRRTLFRQQVSLPLTELTLLAADNNEFPPTRMALEDPNGLLAVGGDLSCERLLEAYRHGIFPWFEHGQPILWWSPNPRTVLFTEQVHTSNSMQKFLRKTPWYVILDRDFRQVMDYCGGQRAKARGTWITGPMKRAYGQIHDAGYAHSVEVYDQQTLVGGLYGIALGDIFFGESMFSLRPNASKTAIILLGKYLHHQGFRFIDCQVASDHLFSLGAEELPRERFERYLREHITTDSIEKRQRVWQSASNKVISKDGYLID